MPFLCRFSLSKATAGGRWVALVALLALLGCTGVPNVGPGVEPQRPGEEQACDAWMQRLDALVDEQGVRDGSAARVAGFGHARVDRLLASFTAEAQASPDRWRAWALRAAALDREARRWEVQNLPDAAVERLGAGGRSAVTRRIAACAGTAWSALHADPAPQRALLDRAQVPDDYALWKRAVGLYPVTRWPFYAGVVRWQAGWERRLQQAQTATGSSRPVLRWSPPNPALSPAEVAAIVAAITPDALGIPQPSEAQVSGLLQAFAPVIEVAQGGPFDRLGRLHWGTAEAPQVDAQQPTVYARVAHTRYGERTLLQLVYSAWFSERPAEGALDLLAGAVDGVVVRLTLTPDGRVLMADSIHACGCYHLFVPGQGLAPRPAPRLGEEWAFAPLRLPSAAPGVRLLWRLASGSHMVESVTVAPQQREVSGGVYQLAHEDQLRSLATPAGVRRSAFAPDGIMPGTQRGERVFFWPMGIAGPGAMRQWGRQPTAFVGRRHFDDPRLIEKRFQPGADWLP